jgi:glucosylceramidase
MKQTIVAAISVFALLAAPSQGASAHSPRHIEVYVTAKGTGQGLAKVGGVELVDKMPPVESEENIFVDPSKTFQTVLGIGGALTDAAAETFYKLPPAKQQEVLRAYFEPQDGIGYTLGRTSIHSCDFSSESYTYVKDGDLQLDSFDVGHDLKYRVPFIKAAIAKAGRDFTLFASPWSPPGWMKDSGDMLHGGKLKPECYELDSSTFMQPFPVQEYRRSHSGPS